MHQEFTHKEIKKIFPWVKTRTLISWSERGLVEPKFGDAEGRGSKRRYSYENLLEIAFADELLNRGITFSAIWTMMSEFQNILRRKDFINYLFIADQLIQYSPPPIGLERYILSGAVSIEKFNNKKIGDIFPAKAGKRLTTSVIIVSLQRIKEFIDAQLKEISG
jgi:DNA-binding transcriptional MerR regulator